MVTTWRKECAIRFCIEGVEMYCSFKDIEFKKLTFVLVPFSFIFIIKKKNISYIFSCKIKENLCKKLFLLFYDMRDDISS